MLADVRLSGGVPRDEVILYFSPAGMVVVAPLPDGVHRIVATVDEAPEHPDVGVRAGAARCARPAAASAPCVHEVLWGSRFRVHHRVADRYRAGRVLLAGDAAHVHSPAGGQGMNAGILDAMRLAGALVKALAGDEAALDAYGSERRPVAQQVVALADRLTRLATVRPGLRALRNAAAGDAGAAADGRARNWRGGCRGWCTAERRGAHRHCPVGPPAQPPEVQEPCGLK